MVLFKNVKKIYNDKIALAISRLEINEGEIFGLVGNNGAGKTTFLSILLDLVKADKGIVKINDLWVNKTEKWKSFTGSYLDKSFLIDFLTPIEYFDLVRIMYNISKSEIIEKLKLYNNFLGEDVLKGKKFIRELSDGNQKKVGIVAAMFINPLILLLDEPHAHLDPTSQILLKKYLLMLNKEFGTTTIISSHNMNFVSEICSRIILLENGKIIKDEKVNENTLQELEAYFNKQINSTEIELKPK